MRKYIACAQFEDWISFFEFGDTPQSAISEFISSGEFENYAEYADLNDGEEVEVRAYTWKSCDDLTEEDEGCCDSCGNHFSFVLDKLIETKMIKFNQSGE